MNLILFEPGEIDRPLPLADPRAIHVLTVLRRRPGDEFDAGVVNGPLGKARLLKPTPESLRFTFEPRTPAEPAAPIILIVGLPRPQTARDILRDATTLGIAALHFVRTGKGEQNYAQSTLWSSGEWQRHLRTGAAQAFCTRVPELSHGRPLDEVLAGLPAAGTRLALDNYEASSGLGECRSLTAPVTLCIGPERGWSADDRAQLRAAGIQLAHLGRRVLRTETACIAALTVLRLQLGLM